jgi:hypothetical protein
VLFNLEVVHNFFSANPRVSPALCKVKRVEEANVIV